jgi:hypothetical protein
MSVETESPAPRARTAATAGLARLRRGSLDRAIANGPASLSLHAVAMSVLTGVAMLCYAANLYLHGAGARSG